MRSDQKILQYLQQLQEKHPRAFRGNYLFYGCLKTKGMLDELKEWVAWGIAALIFIPLYFIFTILMQSTDAGYTATAPAFASLAIMLLFMLYVPLILKQAKHSSHSFYLQHKNTPTKIAILIMLQACNMAYVQSSVLQFFFIFFAVSFGFVRFYKENMFREDTTDANYFTLQQMRRACLWSYKQTLLAKWRYKCLKKGSQAAKLQNIEVQYYLDLHLQLYKYEHEFCKKHKHLDIEKYLDSIM